MITTEYTASAEVVSQHAFRCACGFEATVQVTATGQATADNTFLGKNAAREKSQELAREAADARALDLVATFPCPQCGKRSASPMWRTLRIPPEERTLLNALVLLILGIPIYLFLVALGVFGVEFLLRDAVGSELLRIGLGIVAVLACTVGVIAYELAPRYQVLVRASDHVTVLPEG